MKFLHTSDWHVGKTLKGRPRLDEHTAVLAQIVEHATTHQVDAVLLAGDVYDSAAPSADAQRLVVSTLVRLAQAGIEVVVIAGNHDHAATFEAYRPLMGIAGVTLVGGVHRPDEGGMVTFTARSTGEVVNVAVLPFLSQRYAVRAAQVINNTPAEQTGLYDQHVRDVVVALTAGFTSDTVNIFMSHLTVIGGHLGGGERQAQSIIEYSVPSSALPAGATYTALGHLHRRQDVPAASRVVYSGAPLQIDFGEQDNDPVVVLVEAAPGLPPRTTDLPIAAGRRMRTATGTLEQLVARREEFGDAWLRVYLTEPMRAGLREQVYEELPNTLQIHLDSSVVSAQDRPVVSRQDRSPAELFADYCAAVGRTDERVTALFNELADEAVDTSDDLVG